jgi:hypothetical protein
MREHIGGAERLADDAALRHHEFKTGKLGGRNATMTELWNAALAA